MESPVVRSVFDSAIDALLPIGTNPASGSFEFYHLASSAPGSMVMTEVSVS